MPDPTTPNGAPISDPSQQPGSSALPPQAPVGSPVVADWVGALNEESRGYVQTKGFKDPGQLVESYRQLERLRGVPQERLLTVPDNWDDTEQTSKLYSKLGRPDKPDGYGFKTPEGQDESFTKWAEKNFHDTGLTTSQATKLANKWNEFFSGNQKAALDAKIVNAEKQAADLKKEWGMAYGQNEKVAKLSASKLGVNKDTIDKIEDAIGYDATMKLFHKLGAGMGEGSFVTGDSGNDGGSVLTPESARNQIENLKSDPGFVQKYQNGDIGARQKMENLHKMATFKG